MLWKRPAVPSKFPDAPLPSTSVFGLRPLLGRAFTAEDERTNARVVMMGERMWRTRFGAAPKIRQLAPAEWQPFLVAGVGPASFQVAWDADLSTLYTVRRSPEQRRVHYLRVFGRLKPGVSAAQASASMAGVAAGIAPLS